MKRLALVVIVIALDRMFPSQPPPRIVAEHRRAQALKRQKCLTWSAKIRAAERALNHDREDWAHFENDYDWDEVTHG